MSRYQNQPVYGAAHRAKLKQGRRRRLAQFAELIAEGSTVLDAGKAIGISAASAATYMRQLRDEMGVPTSD